MKENFCNFIKQNQFNIFIYFFINILLGFEIYYFLINTKAIYIWDTLGYHISTSNMIDMLKQGEIGNFFSFVKSSLKYSDYNVASQLPLIPFNFFDSNNRFLFVLSMSIVYISPCIFVVYLFIKNIFKIENKFLLFLITLYAIQFAPLIIPAFSGLQDISCCLFFMIIFYMYFKNPIEDRSYKSLILFGIFLYMPFLLKKASLYGIVAFFIVFGLYSLFFLYKKGFSFSGFKNLFLKYSFVGLIILLMMLILQKGMLIKILFSNEYFGYYADWQVNNLYSNLIFNTFPGYAGLLIMVTSFLGFILLLKSTQAYKHIFILFVLWSLCFALMQIQLAAFSLQHFQQAVSIALCFLSINLFIFLYNKINNKKVFYSFIILIIAIHYIINILVVNHTINNRNVFTNKRLLPSFIEMGTVNYDNIINLLKFVNNTAKKNNLKIAIANSGYFKDGIDSESLKSYSFYFDNSYLIKNNLIVRLPVLDSSHLSIFNNIFDASLLVIVYPVELMSEKQKIIEILNSVFAQNINIAKAFTLESEFKLQNSKFTYRVYKRIRLNTKAEIKDFFDIYLTYHPQNKLKIDEIINKLNIK